MLVRTMHSEQVKSEGLIDQIIGFERANLQSVFAEAGLAFDEELRRKNFDREMTVILVYDARNQLVGYLDFGPHWKRPNEIYLYSLQIAEEYRQGILIYQLLNEARKELACREFDLLRCNVHKTNQVAVNLYRKLGFTLEESPINLELYRVSAGPKIFQQKIFQRMERRFRSQGNK